MARLGVAEEREIRYSSPFYLRSQFCRDSLCRGIEWVDVGFPPPVVSKLKKAGDEAMTKCQWGNFRVRVTERGKIPGLPNNRRRGREKGDGGGRTPAEIKKTRDRSSTWIKGAHPTTPLHSNSHPFEHTEIVKRIRMSRTSEFQLPGSYQTPQHLPEPSILEERIYPSSIQLVPSSSSFTSSETRGILHTAGMQPLPPAYVQLFHWPTYATGTWGCPRYRRNWKEPPGRMSRSWQERPKWARYVSGVGSSRDLYSSLSPYGFASTRWLFATRL